jgi:hypothetical protein
VVFDDLNPLLMAIARVAIRLMAGTGINSHAIVGHLLLCRRFVCGICRTSINAQLMLHLPWRISKEIFFDQVHTQRKEVAS